MKKYILKIVSRRQQNKQFGPISGPTERHSSFGSKPFDTLVVFLKAFLKKSILKKKSADDNKANRLNPSQDGRSVGPDLEPTHLTL